MAQVVGMQPLEFLRMAAHNSRPAAFISAGSIKVHSAKGLRLVV